VIEVISHKNSNLAKGRYILAQSTGKDAADLVTVMIITKLFSIRKMDIKLVTNDHFGGTLKDIYHSRGENLVIYNVKEKK
jgi:hypothetical protein